MNAPTQSSRRKWPARLLFALACLVTLFVFFHAEENWRGERAWNDYKRAHEANGERFDLVAFAPPRVPDEQNFAMTPFLAPLFDYKPGTQQPRDTNAVRRLTDFAKSLPSTQEFGRWQLGEKTDLAAWRAAFQKPAAEADKSAVAAAAVLTALDEYAPVLEELRAASRRPNARFNLAYDLEDPIEILLPHYQVLRRVCQVLSLRASSELALRRTAQAFDDVGLMLHVADSIRDEPFLISLLVRVSELNLALQVIWDGLADHRWSDEQLQALQTRLQSCDLMTAHHRTLQAERAGFGNGAIEFLIKSPHRGQFLSVLTDTGGPSPNVMGDLIFGVVPRGWFRLEQLNYNRMFEEVCLTGFDVQARRVFPRISEEKEKLLAQGRENRVAIILHHRVLTYLGLPAVGSVLQKVALAQSSVDEAALACALERCRLADGKFPGSLDALAPRFISKLPHDIISGEPLKYRRTDDGQFVLYSVGWNEKDDGGVVAPTADKRPDLKKGDWVWSYTAKP